MKMSVNVSLKCGIMILRKCAGGETRLHFFIVGNILTLHFAILGVSHMINPSAVCPPILAVSFWASPL